MSDSVYDFTAAAPVDTTNDLAVAVTLGCFWLALLCGFLLLWWLAHQPSDYRHLKRAERERRALGRTVQR